MITFGLINFHYSNHNYGAVLQAAALQHLVISKGYRAEHIDFIPEAIYGSRKEQFKVSILNSLAKMKVIRLFYNKPLASNSDVFENFRNKWIKRSRKTFTTVKELTEHNFEYKGIIVGSDQVWRPNYTVEHSPAYFLSFGDDGIRKISYAASFGVDKWEFESVELELINYW